MNFEDRIYHFVRFEDWSAIEDLESFLYVFDRLPRRMKIIVELKCDPNGYTDEQIAKMLMVKKDTVQKTLRRAKKTFVAAIL